jgi:hypothetical protein
MIHVRVVSILLLVAAGAAALGMGPRVQAPTAINRGNGQIEIARDCMEVESQLGKQTALLVCEKPGTSDLTGVHDLEQ